MTALRLDGPTGHLARVATLLLLLTAIGVFHVWSRTRVVAVGYALGELQREHVTLTTEHDRLRIEVETLRSPAMLERVARNRLGMAPPAPGAVTAAGPRFAKAGEGGRGMDGLNHSTGPAGPSPSSEVRNAAARPGDPRSSLAPRSEAGEGPGAAPVLLARRAPASAR
jgi:cell division protein FtsL